MTRTSRRTSSPAATRALGAAACVLGLLTPRVDAFSYKLDETYTETAKWSFTEMYMFGSGQGPMPWSNGDANIKVNLNLGVSTKIPESKVEIAVAFYHDSHADLFLPEQDLCAFQKPDGVSDIQFHKFEGTVGEDKVFNVAAQADYKVLTSGVQNVLFQVCPTTAAVDKVTLKGNIDFKNPYGYLPGRFNGYLPFEGARFFAFLLFDALFMVAFVVNRKELLNLHYAILFALIVATGEALAWFLAFDDMNSTGVPYCCPFPTAVVTAMVCELFQKTFSRALLLVICLGYGVVRPRLNRGERLALLTLSVVYLAASVMDEASEIAEARAITNETPAGDRMWWGFPALLCDIVFLSWIYMSLVTTMKTLHKNSETYKLDMYTRLSTIIGSFVALFGVLTLVVLLSRANIIVWPWNLMWAETVSWEVLNFAVLAAICWIWRPSPTSKYLAQSQQLPTVEEDDDDVMEMSPSSGGTMRLTPAKIVDDSHVDNEEQGLL